MLDEIDKFPPCVYKTETAKTEMGAKKIYDKKKEKEIQESLGIS